MPYHFIRLTALSLACLLGASPAFAGKTLDAVKQRGMVNCGVHVSLPGFSAADSQGKWSGLDVDLCRAVASAVLSDPNKVKYTPLNPQQRFTALQSGEIDLLARNSTITLTRDASLGLIGAGVNYYDGQAFIVQKSLKVKSAKELDGASICVESGTTTEKNLADYFRSQNIKYKPVVFDTPEAAKQAFFSGRCQSYTTDGSGLASMRATESKTPDDLVILPEIISKEPLGPFVRRGDDEWYSIVKWSLYAMLEAEENGLTKANVDQQKTASKDPVVQRILGTGEDMGTLLGLDKEWAYRIIKNVGNYGESFEANLGKGSKLGLERGLNNQWNKGGLMYALPIR